ncbi:MAG: hypothetical protein IJE21_02980 [Alistipes sp.]|nr:hypothetical protein [Alistipes sp.]
MKRILSIFVYALAIAFNSIAQEKAKVIVNGLQLCDTYTRTQMYEALGGTPDKIEAEMEEPGSFWFYYGKDVFYWRYDGMDAYKDGINNHCFGGCRLCTDRYVVFDSIRVGDPVSKLKTVPGMTKDHPRKYKDGKCVGGGYVEWYQSEELRRDGIGVMFHYDELTKIINRIHIYVLFL